MSKKFCFLISIILAFSFCVSLDGAVVERALDVNNYSFELKADGTQACGHTGNPGLAWEDSGNWIGQDIYCGSEIFCMSCEPFAEGCNCKTWRASEGEIMVYMQTNDIDFKQLIEGETILANHQYKLTMDAMSWDPAVRFTASVYYPSGQNEINAAEKDIILEEETDPNIAEWKEYSVVVVAPTGHPGIGQPLGIKFFAHKDGDDDRWPFLDNIRLTEKLATDAWKPNPEDGSINMPLDTASLSWSPGLWTDTHNVYFSTDFEQVNDVNTAVRIATDIEANTVPIPVTLQLGGEYFWLVEEVNAAYHQVDPNDLNTPPDGPWPGSVWSFKTNDGKAYAFSPVDGAEDIPVDVVLNWIPGQVAASHNVYFSTDYDDVNNRSGGVNIGPNSWNPPGDLALGQTYYWAVDEVNGAVLGSPWQSEVMSFTVIGYRVVDDMESYETGVTNIYSTWIQSGRASINLETGDANYTQDDQSMEFRFDNDNTPYYSRTTRTFGSAQNWSEVELKSLVLSFIGDFSNDETAIQPMYVSVSDDTNTGTVEYDDPNDLMRGWMGWQEWNIELQDFADAGVNLSNITEMTIKIGDGSASGDGYVYFDNIRTYPARCVEDEAIGSFTYDCDIDLYDFAVLGRDWLMSGIGSVTASAPSDSNLVGHWTLDDNVSSGPSKSDVLDSSVNSNDGLLYDDVYTSGPQDGNPKLGATATHSTSGVISAALTFDGFDDFVEVPVLDLNSNTVTISAWIKRNGEQPIYAGIVHCQFSADPNDPNAPSTMAGFNFGSGGTYGYREFESWAINHELCYFWSVDATGASFQWSYDFHTGLIVPDNIWAFVALVVEPEKATVYMDDGLTFASATNHMTHNPELFNGPTHIADQMQFAGRLFDGLIDEVRIYNRSLSAGEVLALGPGGSVYLPLEPWRANANDDDIVDLKDLDVMVDGWLSEILFP